MLPYAMLINPSASYTASGKTLATCCAIKPVCLLDPCRSPCSSVSRAPRELREPRELKESCSKFFSNVYPVKLRILASALSIGFKFDLIRRSEASVTYPVAVTDPSTRTVPPTCRAAVGAEVFMPTFAARLLPLRTTTTPSMKSVAPSPNASAKPTLDVDPVYTRVPKEV